jgi:hypothetical protein
MRIRLQKTSLIAIFLVVFFSLAVVASPHFVQAVDDAIFGTIEAPAGVDVYQGKVKDGEIGIILFASTLIRLITVAAGIWTMFNFVFAGWIYITSEGDAAAHGKVSSKMTNSIIGLVIVALSYTIAAVIGLLIFNDAGFIINPTLESAITQPPAVPHP